MFCLEEVALLLEKGDYTSDYFRSSFHSLAEQIAIELNNGYFKTFDLLLSTESAFNPYKTPLWSLLILHVDLPEIVERLGNKYPPHLYPADYQVDILLKAFKKMSKMAISIIKDLKWNKSHFLYTIRKTMPFTARKKFLLELPGMGKLKTCPVSAVYTEMSVMIALDMLIHLVPKKHLKSIRSNVLSRVTLGRVQAVHFCQQLQVNKDQGFSDEEIMMILNWENNCLLYHLPRSKALEISESGTWRLSSEQRMILDLHKKTPISEKFLEVEV